MPGAKRITDQPEGKRKGTKTRRGKPLFYDECKKRTTVTLTPTANEGLNEIAKKHQLSVSEFMERIGRGIIQVIEPERRQEIDLERLARRIVELMKASEP